MREGKGEEGSGRGSWRYGYFVRSSYVDRPYRIANHVTHIQKDDI